ncbi:hypothetical protein N7492_007009 [Penicillium capsulatum]|uniref:4-coumarate-CoA ligase n=1 Tax=Penicillium capsulatum TaxID=69766 RepID=A0A9W9HZ15_9EURO|nr:hypothetical protein N7492_007009 [Penicillium capsulatum]KAJ6116842.1 hypothetical protein N7512_006567 [Penicillium capsulatum]
MPYKSRWQIDIPHAHLASVLLTSPTASLSTAKPCFLEAARPDTHFLTPHTFRLWSQRVAAGLRRSGVKTGDRVLLFAGNDLFYPVVFMGVIMAGAIFTGANPTYVARELAFQLQDSGATYLLCARASLAAGLEAAKQAGISRDRVFVYDSGVYEGRGASQDGCRYWGELVATEEEGRGFAWDELSTPELADRTLVLNYSSGTTGKPKGVEITHKNYVANMLQYNFFSTLWPDHQARQERARWLCFLPMYHAMAQNIYIAAALGSNTPVYIMPRFDFIQVLEYVQTFRITELILVPPVMVLLAKHPAVKKYDLSSVDNVASGAAPLGREVCVDVEKLWPPGKINVKQGWGMTEVTCSMLGWDPREISTSASVGKPNPNCEAKLMADDGSEIVEPNQRGELWVRGPNVMKGYWRNAEATRQTKTNDGWLKSGDIAYVDEQGTINVVDRIKELIKVKGFQVAPAELEALLLEHPAIADVAVIGVTINDNECPRAYVVRKPGQSPTPQEILRFMDGKVSAIKRITGGVEFLEAIPKNPSGKILRKVLREQAQAALKGATAKL